jgi:hypothetical protein
MTYNLYIYTFIYLVAYLVLRIQSSDARISTGLPVGSFCSFCQCFQTNGVKTGRGVTFVYLTIRNIRIVYKAPQHRL